MEKSSGLPRPSRQFFQRKPSNGGVTTSSALCNAEPKLHTVRSRASFRLPATLAEPTPSLRQPTPLASLGHSKINSVSGASVKGKEKDAFKEPATKLSSRQQKPDDRNEDLGSKCDATGRANDGQMELLDRWSSQPSSDSVAERPFAVRERKTNRPPSKADFQTPKTDKKSRPSLSDRTIESLSQISPSPASGRRSSNFFSPEGPMFSRPGSAMSSRMRPGTSEGSYGRESLARPVSPCKPFRVPYRMSVGPGAAIPTPGKRSVSAAVPHPLVVSKKPAMPAMPSISEPRKSSMQASVITSNGLTTPRVLKTSKTVAVRSSRPPFNIDDTFNRPKSAAGRARPVSPSETNTTATAPPEAAVRKASISSGALRGQIARAKASRRPPAGRESQSHNHDLQFSGNLLHQPKENVSKLLERRIESARIDGRLNIAAMELTQIPVEVLNMYDIKSMSSSSLAWNEVVDLIRLNAADNRIEELQNDMFPDIDGHVLMEEENAKRGLFRGLQALDCHGNLLQTLPLGLRRLELLTFLNLSYNRFSSPTLEVICQIPNLKDLRLAGNQITGQLTDSVGKLRALEVLDVHDNKIVILPQSLRELVNLRTLNVAGNDLATLPMDAIAYLPLVEIVATSNSLHGALFPDTVMSLSKLQTLDVANNCLVSLIAHGDLHLPAIRQLNVSNNRLDMVPDVSQWAELLNLQAQNNRLTDMPTGLGKIAKLRLVNLESNSITGIDEEVASSQSLETLRVGCNPLRQRKYLSMSCEEIKRDLAKSLFDCHTRANEESSLPEGESSNAWKLTKDDTLDLSSQRLEHIDADALGTFLAQHTLRNLNLHHNLFASAPVALLLAQDLITLDISHNILEFALVAPLILPQLNQLTLAHNKLTSFFPITTFLTAPNLRLLDVRANRITGALPVLRQRFKNLTSILATDNAISEISVDALRGVETADLSRNDIGHLPPELGLLSETLRNLQVGGNAFRVPRYTILEKGTEATLAWLRDKLPAGNDTGDKAETRTGQPVDLEIPDWGAGLLGAVV